MKKTLEEKILEAKLFVQNNHQDKYVYIDGYYKNYKKKGRINGVNELFIKLQCVHCNGIFERKYCNFKKNDRCFRCVSYSQVSFLHLHISQMGERYFNNVELEKDIGFKGDTGRISHYDLYIPNHNKFGNFIIEFQSRFHDTKSDFDRRKKEFAISKGYTFMSFDERRVDENDISVMLFGKVIDDDIRKLSYKKYAPDLTCCQELINQHYTIKKISEELNIPISFLYKRYCDGVFNIPKDRKEKIFNKKSIVRIDNNNNIKYFDSPYQVFLQYGYNISKLKYGIMIYSQGYFWVIKSDYISGNYVAHKKYKYVNLAN